jgi:hypothetical protein
MLAQQVEVNQAVGAAFEDHLASIAAPGDVAPRDVSIAATRANRATINEKCGKRAEDLRGASRPRFPPVSWEL